MQVAVTGRPLAAGRVTGWADPAVAIQHTYLAAIRRAGGRDATLEPRVVDAAEARAVLAPFDALVLTGGADVDPATYGQTPHERTYGTNPTSDAFERALLEVALERGVPVLAICRGLQVLDVARGGTLHQHLPERPGVTGHGVPGTGAAPELHPVDLEPGSLAATALGTTRVARCSSHHHQGVDRVGEGLVVTGRSPDGVIEALELPGAWVLAVQWHPEDTAAHDAVQQRCFDALVAQAAEAGRT